MSWRKLGLVFTPDSRYPWLLSHAACPTPLHIGGDFFRIYFAARDRLQRPQIGYVELDINSPKDQRTLSAEPVIALGRPGQFDDSGLYPGSLVVQGERLLMYYCGRRQTNGPMFDMAVGLAVSHDHGKNFSRISESAILSRGPHDPWMVSTPFVLREKDRWRMWYLSGLTCDLHNGTLNSRYHLKYAESADGFNWRRDGHIAIELMDGQTNIARPVVLQKNGSYEMWYSYTAGAEYRIGYAKSGDGRNWKRMDDQIGIGLSPKGWDSKAQAYPYVFEHNNRQYLLYNGNQLGKDGFGLAVWD